MVPIGTGHLLMRVTMELGLGHEKPQSLRVGHEKVTQRFVKLRMQETRFTSFYPRGAPIPSGKLITNSES